jgi:hypothetical protein
MQAVPSTCFPAFPPAQGSAHLPGLPCTCAYGRGFGWIRGLSHSKHCNMIGHIEGRALSAIHLVLPLAFLHCAIHQGRKIGRGYAGWRC